MNPAEEFQLNDPTPAGLPPAALPRQKSRAWLWWTISAVVVIGLGGGGYFAYSRGLISIPGLSPKSDALFDKMVSSIGDIKQAQYSLRVNVQAEPRDGQAKPIFSNKNQNINGVFPNDDLSLVGGFASLFNPQEALRALPADLKLSGGVTVYIDGQKPIADADGLLKLDGSYTVSDASASVDFELRKVARNLYGIVHKFPNIFIDLSAVKEKWVVVTPDDGNEFVNQVFENRDSQQAIKTLQSSLKRALDGKLFTVKQKLKAESITGVRSEHFLIAVDPTKLSQVYEALRDERKAKDENVEDLQKIIDELKKPETLDLLKRLADNSQIEVWVDRVHGFLRQVSWTIIVVPDDSVERLKKTQFKLELKLTLDKVNQKVSVDKPSTTIDFDEANRLVTGISKEEQQYNKQVDRMSNVRDALSLYHTEKNSYPASLDELSSSLKIIYSACQVKLDLNKTDKSDDARARARDTKRRSDINQIRMAINLYHDDNINNNYPVTLKDVGTTYLQTMPTDPDSKAEYTYEVCNNNQHFVLSTALETTKEKYYASDMTYSSQSTTPLTCSPVITDTNSSDGGFKIGQIDSNHGLGGEQCTTEKKYRDGVNTTDIFANKPFIYTKTGEDFTLVYQMKFYKGIDDYKKEGSVEGKNTATSKDDSVEGMTSNEKYSQEHPVSNVNTNVNSGVSIEQNSATDTDHDGINDTAELGYGTAINKPDTDDDGLGDYEEIYKYHTSPLQKNTDGDAYDDKTEIDNGYNPNGPGPASLEQLQEWGGAPSQTGGPILNNIIVTSSSPGVAVISWTANTNSDGIVNAGTTTAYGVNQRDFIFSTTHTIYVPVAPETTYHYSIHACTPNPNSLCTTTPDKTFIIP